MKGLSFAGVAKGGQHAVARWVISLWGKSPSEVQIVARRGSHGLRERWTPRDGELAPFGCLHENWTVREVLKWGMPGERQVVCTVRDLLNWFSSWWQHPGAWPGPIPHEERIRIWCENAQALLDARPSVLFIKFNSWVSDEDYRRGLAKALDRPFTDHTLKVVGGHEGGWSSFGEAKPWKDGGVLRRWERLGRNRRSSEDPLDYITDEALALNARIFGDIYPGTVKTLREALR